jgi:hypothetical protein
MLCVTNRILILRCSLQSHPRKRYRYRLRFRLSSASLKTGNTDGNVQVHGLFNQGEKVLFKNNFALANSE